MKTAFSIVILLACFIYPAHASKHHNHGYRHHYRHHDGVHRHYAKRHRGHRASVSTAGMPAPLAAKVAELRSACGSVVTSGYRPGAIVAGSRNKKHPNGTVSNHARGTAADVAGNPRCIYAHLHGWPGGYSTDYSAVKHVHISYNHGHEWGARFVHGGGYRHYAHRRVHYARR